MDHARLAAETVEFVRDLIRIDFAAFGLFHAVDERVPLDALRFGARVTERILRTA